MWVGVCLGNMVRGSGLPAAKYLGHFWLGYIRMMGHLQLIAH